MPPQTHHPELQGWQRLAGTWATEATHPDLPGTVIAGRATFEWLEDQLSANDGATWEPDLAITFRRLG